MAEPYIPLLRDLSEITPDIARHVLAYYGASGGHLAGSFTMSLIGTIARADIVNLALLATGYPGYVKAVTLASRTDTGVDRLQEIAAGDLHG